MAKAVWKINEEGRRTYVGHVPSGYKLKENEYFGIPPENIWKINKNGKRIYVGHVPEDYKLKENEHFGIPPESVWKNKDVFVEVIRDA